MKIETYLVADNAKKIQFSDRIVIVIDVLRSGSTICEALNNDALKIIPTATVGDAGKIAENCDKKITLFCGERNCKPIDGFDLGNSPEDYTKEIVSKKNIVLTSTNGSKALLNANTSLITIICSFNNFLTVIDFLKTVKRDFVIICAGQEGKFSLEDTFLAGKIIDSFSRYPNLQLNDAAISAKIIFRYFRKDLKGMIYNNEQGKYLAEIGLKKDIDFAIQEDIYDFLPISIDKVIVKRSISEAKELLVKK